MPTRILHIQSTLDLEKTAGRIFETLSVENPTERESDNYPGGIYYMGELGDLQIKVAGESDDGLEDYQYWVVLSTPEESNIPIDDLTEAMVVELIRAGFPAAREAGFTETAIERQVYSLEPSGRLVTRRETRALS